MCLKKLFGKTEERPSPSDIVPKENIIVLDNKVTIYYSGLNIPFAVQPKIKGIMDIPDTNSMDGLLDYGHNLLYIEPAIREDHETLCNWLWDEFQKGERSKWKEGGANDCVYRIMANRDDDPRDFTKPHVFYAIHRIWKVGFNSLGRYWIFKGINNPSRDPVVALDKNILCLNTGIVY